MCEPDEIEITPEMVEAGRMLIEGYDPRFELPGDLAEAVYLAMASLRPSRRVT